MELKYCQDDLMKCDPGATKNLGRILNYQMNVNWTVVVLKLLAKVETLSPLDISLCSQPLQLNTAIAVKHLFQ